MEGGRECLACLRFFARCVSPGSRSESETDRLRDLSQNNAFVLLVRRTRAWNRNSKPAFRA